MRHLSLSICALAGAIMASAGTLAESSAGARRFNELDSWGMFLAVAFSLATLVSVIRATRAAEASQPNE